MATPFRTPPPGRRVRARLRPGDILYDDRGEALELQAELGGGGQGRVWSLTGGRAAVKILNAEGSDGPGELRTRLAVVRRFDLAGIPIARPHSLLTGEHAGYTMELLDELAPVGALAAVPASRPGAWFQETGGLARRLRLLSLAAEAFDRLHSRGIAYGDISPGNILVSASSDHDQVWLIDPDNLSVERGHGGSAYFTTGYGAPEVVARTSGQDTLTDAFSFAVLAFQVLALAHPFVGDDVYRYPDRHEPAAFAGRLPWIDHTGDERNRTTQGLDRELVLTKGLRILARRAFEDGLHAPEKRPSMREWHEKLEQAALMMVPCPECGGTFHAALALCPWCRRRERPPILRCDVHGHVPAGRVPDVDEDTETDRLQTLVLAARQPRIVRARGALLYLDRGPADIPIDPGEPVAEFDWDGRERLLVRRVGRHPVWMVNRAARRVVELSTGEACPIDVAEAGRWTVHFGRRHEPHRFIKLLLPRTGAR
ncbi:hypothetical protein [Actinomadura sp. 3N508]|uniref:protein kinase domain-containing protein n=1 Tax=Actinomadura sp. 3N508 TaxID=3375153 RepID=UPI0037AE3DF5